MRGSFLRFCWLAWAEPDSRQPVQSVPGFSESIIQQAKKRDVTVKEDSKKERIPVTFKDISTWFDSPVSSQ